VRIDSGDLPGQASAVRKQLDRLGAKATKITVTSDLDEYAIAALQVAPVDSYGVGTSVVTGSGAPTAGMVYKLVARVGSDGEWVSVAKKSAAKLSVGGRKFPVRSLVDGQAASEVLHVEDDPDAPTARADAGRALLVPLVTEGVADPRYLGAAGTALAREHRAAAVAELPADAFRLARGEPVIPTVYE
jgi:nicotinate phosphoribosyltransferase